MRVLWFAPVDYFGSCGYHGGGWVSGLQSAISEHAQVELGIAFPHTGQAMKKVTDNVTFYSLAKKEKSNLQKMFYYWYGYKNEPNDRCLPACLDIIRDFKPDVIQIFGIETEYSCLTGRTDVPHIVHLQGILNPYTNAYYPPGTSYHSLLWDKFSFSEWVKHSGYNFIEEYLRKFSKAERTFFGCLKFVMGRTEWDYQIATLLSPAGLKYFHVDEVLRDDFYQISSRNIPSLDKCIILTTISPTFYKGLDVVLKSAQLLKETTDINFEWRIIGIEKNDWVVRFFEKHCKINSGDVNIRYEGICNSGMLCDQMSQSHIYVHPSYIDNSPNSLCEAQIAGLPVIGTYVGGIPSLITHNDNGLLVPANAPFEIAYWLQHLYKHPEETTRLGRSARENARIRHDPKKIASEVLSVYHETIKNWK